MDALAARGHSRGSGSKFESGIKSEFEYLRTAVTNYHLPEVLSLAISFRTIFSLVRGIVFHWHSRETLPVLFRRFVVVSNSTFHVLTLILLCFYILPGVTSIGALATLRIHREQRITIAKCVLTLAAGSPEVYSISTNLKKNFEHAWELGHSVPSLKTGVNFNADLNILIFGHYTMKRNGSRASAILRYDF